MVTLCKRSKSNTFYTLIYIFMLMVKWCHNWFMSIKIRWNIVLLFSQSIAKSPYTSLWHIYSQPCIVLFLLNFLPNPTKERTVSRKKIKSGHKCDKVVMKSTFLCTFMVDIHILLACKTKKNTPRLDTSPLSHSGTELPRAQGSPWPTLRFDIP